MSVETIGNLRGHDCLLPEYVGVGDVARCDKCGTYWFVESANRLNTNWRKLKGRELRRFLSAGPPEGER